MITVNQLSPTLAVIRSSDSVVSAFPKLTKPLMMIKHILEDMPSLEVNQTNKKITLWIICTIVDFGPLAH